MKTWTSILRRAISVGSKLSPALLALVLLFVGSLNAQNLINSGSINNSGTFRVRGQTTGLPDTIGGVFEFNGANQPIEPRRYQTLRLLGSGIKTITDTTTVSNVLLIDTNVVFHTSGIAVVDLMGTMMENGYLEGRIQKTELLGGSFASDFGNIGGTISWSGTAPGLTTLKRIAGDSVVGQGNQSIKRYYEIVNTATGLNASLVLRYENFELNGHDSTELFLWRSFDGGTTWIDEGGVVNPPSRTITRTALATIGGLWAIADSAHALGQIGSVAANIDYIAGNNQIDTIGTRLDTMSVRVTTATGLPVQGHPVVFAIANTPPGATGQGLTVTLATTNADGIASTQLILGNKVGTYAVTASAEGLTGSPVTFTATATNGLPAVLAAVSGNNQTAPIFTQLLPFIARITDRGDNPVSGSPATFAIISTPTGATGQQLSTETAVSNDSGWVSTTLTLGSKVGTYSVSVISQVSGVSVTFTAEAQYGTATNLAAIAGNNQTDTILSPLTEPLVVTVLDQGENPIPGITTTFAITGTPSGAIGQSLSVTSTLTDSLGNARTILTLGSKVGTYTVSATFTASNGSRLPLILVQQAVRPVYTTDNAQAGETRANVVLKMNPATPAADSVAFTSFAIHGAPASIASVSGDNQIGYIGDPLDAPFEAMVTDVGGNAVPGTPVQFSIIEVPFNASGYALSVTNTVTDSFGRASTRLTVGDSVGVYKVRALASALPESAIVFTTNATVIIGDPNNDRFENVADLTMIIDHVLGRLILSGLEFKRADVNRDGSVDIRDAVIVVNQILHNDSLAARYSAHPKGSAASSSADINLRATFEVSSAGMRVNLTNNVPVKGVQIILKLRQPAMVDSANYVFPRASMMTVAAATDSSDTVRLLAYNFLNVEIPEGDGGIFRLPVFFTDTTQFDVVEVIVSTLGHQGIRVPASKVQPAPQQYPAAYKLEQNYPNPFNSSTIIYYEIPDRTFAVRPIEIEIFNTLGQKVKTLVSDWQDAGRYTVRWDGTNSAGAPLPSGVYFYRIVAFDHVSSKKMIMLK